MNRYQKIHQTLRSRTPSHHDATVFTQPEREKNQLSYANPTNNLSNLNTTASKNSCLPTNQGSLLAGTSTRQTDTRKFTKRYEAEPPHTVTPLSSLSQRERKKTLVRKPNKQFVKSEHDSIKKQLSPHPRKPVTCDVAAETFGCLACELARDGVHTTLRQSLLPYSNHQPSKKNMITAEMFSVNTKVLSIHTHAWNRVTKNVAAPWTLECLSLNMSNMQHSSMHQFVKNLSWN